MEKQKHSGLGIVSFITSIISGVLMFLIIVITVVTEASRPRGVDKVPVSPFINALFLLILMWQPLALGLGIGGLLQKERKKIFAIMGIELSVASILIIIFILIIGLALN